MRATSNDPLRVLIAYDGSVEAAGAIDAAARLLPRARAIVVHGRGESVALEHAALARIAMPDSVIAPSAAAYERAAEEASRDVAERGSALADEAGLDATATIREATSPWRAICLAGQEQRADVIVCGARGLGGFARSLLGSTSSSLVHHADRPVLVIPSGAREVDGPVLIGFDGSDGARAAVAGAARLFRGRPALVVHAWPSPVQRSFVGQSLLSAPVGEIGELAGDLDEMFADQAQAVADDGAALARDQGLDARGIAVESGAGAWRALAATAREEGAAVIVAGSRGRGALSSTVLGSVSSALVHNAELPVLIVRGQTSVPGRTSEP
jgi:nucleotide-binding universal stress UspA family protein